MPFDLKEDGTLEYRGINVNSGDTDDINKLEEYMDETLYIDIGFGMQEANGVLQDDSAFNTAVSGLKMLGYGNTDDGISKNVVTLLGQMADVLEKEHFDEEKYSAMLDQFTECKIS